VTETGAPPDYRLGFRSLEQELVLDSLPPEGRLPAWLRGSLYRIGPAKFEVGERSLNHWFDGFGMLHRFSFGDGGVSYANRFVESRAYLTARDTGRLGYSEVASDPDRSLFGRVSSAFKPKISDSANHNVLRLGGELVALGAGPVPHLLDPRTLAVRGAASRGPGEILAAHPHLDPAAGESLFIAVKVGARPTYRLFARHGTRSLREIARLPAPRPSLLHSFALTERYVVFAECPFLLNPLDLIMSGRPFIENCRWLRDRPSFFNVIDRRSGELRARLETEPFFCGHHVNAFERGGELLVDLVAYEDAEILAALYLDRLRGEAGLPGSELRRYRLSPDTGQVSWRALAEGMEAPRIDYQGRNARPYRFAYGCALGSEGFYARIQKTDVDAASTIEWSEPGVFPGEAVFVAAPGAGREDDGVLLSLVLEPAAATSFLLVLDARDLTELCRARLPHAVPFDHHGAFYPEQ
jgi:carotenoid cleavage dioxygenase-like enzyme